MPVSGTSSLTASSPTLSDSSSATRRRYDSPRSRSQVITTPSQVACFALSRDGRVLVSAENGPATSIIRVWDALSGGATATMCDDAMTSGYKQKAHICCSFIKKIVVSVALSADGTSIAAVLKVCHSRCMITTHCDTGLPRENRARAVGHARGQRTAPRCCLQNSYRSGL